MQKAGSTDAKRNPARALQITEVQRAAVLQEQVTAGAVCMKIFGVVLVLTGELC